MWLLAGFLAIQSGQSPAPSAPKAGEAHGLVVPVKQDAGCGPIERASAIDMTGPGVPRWPGALAGRGDPEAPATRLEARQGCGSSPWSGNTVTRVAMIDRST